jgi:NADH-quinone oxidoreductase subunit F
VARSVDQELMSRSVFTDLYIPYDYSKEIPLEPSTNPMGRPKLVPPEERRGNFQEIALGFSGEQAKIEAERCLRCDVRSNAMSPWR